MKLLLLIANLALAVSIPYSYGSTVAEYHFFDIPNLTYRDHSHKTPAFQSYDESHFHISIEFCPGSRISVSKFSTADHLLAIAQNRQALASEPVLLCSWLYPTGLSPPDALRKPASGRSPPPDAVV